MREQRGGASVISKVMRCESRGGVHEGVTRLEDAGAEGACMSDLQGYAMQERRGRA